jgi:hypothetical protein
VVGARQFDADARINAPENRGTRENGSKQPEMGRKVSKYSGISFESHYLKISDPVALL